jgi:4-amino-4-deoxy-L-arabinose transferase-like glycosyltransferase
MESRSFERSDFRNAALVVVAAAILLGIGAGTIPITAAFQDRIGQIRSQDEATYSRAVLEMLARGDWLTPHLMGRLFLLKPPLLYWLSALSIDLLGVSRLALRLPSVLAGAFSIGIVFLWCRRLGSPWTGLIGATLLLSNATWETMSRLNSMDVLLAFWVLLAVFLVFRDPSLSQRSSIIGFGVATGAAIMTKNVAGVIPILALSGYFLASKPAERPALRSILLGVLTAAVVAAPWHLYQLAAHTRWFWTEYIQNQLLGFGMHPPAETSPDPHLWFYAKRIFLTDPVLVLLFALGLPKFIRSVIRREAPATLLAVWLATVLFALTAFQARNYLYAVLLIAPLCLVAAAYSLARARFESVLLAVLLVVGVGKIAANADWDLAFYRIPTPEAQPALRQYAAKARPNELILVQSDDEFYAFLLPIPRLRYCFIDATGAVERYAPHLALLGISMPVERFLHLDRYQASYRATLEEWGLDSAEPLATALIARNDAEVLALIHDRPQSDFYLPRSIVAGVLDQIKDTHDVEQVAGDRLLLLARQSLPGARSKVMPYLSPAL